MITKQNKKTTKSPNKFKTISTSNPSPKWSSSQKKQFKRQVISIGKIYKFNI